MRFTTRNLRSSWFADQCAQMLGINQFARRLARAHKFHDYRLNKWLARARTRRYLKIKFELSNLMTHPQSTLMSTAPAAHNYHSTRGRGNEIFSKKTTHNVTCKTGDDLWQTSGRGRNEKTKRNETKDKNTNMMSARKLLTFCALVISKKLININNIERLKQNLILLFFLIRVEVSWNSTTTTKFNVSIWINLSGSSSSFSFYFSSVIN